MGHKSNLNHFILCVLLIVALLLLCAPALAQDATPEPTLPPGDVTVITPPAGSPVVVYHDDNPYLLIGLGVLGVLLIILAILWTLDRHKLAHYALEILPDWAREDFLNNRAAIDGDVDEGFDEIDTLAAATTTPIDDLLSRYGRAGVHGIVDAVADALHGPEEAAPAPDTSQPAPDSRVIVEAVTPVPPPVPPER